MIDELKTQEKVTILNGFIIDFSNSLYNYTNLKKLIYE
jgi:hypothetical protein